MVEYAWTQVMGHSPLEGIEGFEGDDFQARQALILAQQSFMQNLTERFVRENYNMRLLYVRLFTSTWYRIKSLSPPVDDRMSDAVFEGSVDMAFSLRRNTFVALRRSTVSHGLCVGAPFVRRIG